MQQNETYHQKNKSLTTLSFFPPDFLFIHNSAAKVFTFIREERDGGSKYPEDEREEKNRRARSAFTEHLFCCGSGRTIAPWRSKSFGGDVTHVAPHESAGEDVLPSANPGHAPPSVLCIMTGVALFRFVFLCQGAGRLTTFVILNYGQMTDPLHGVSLAVRGLNSCHASHESITLTTRLLWTSATKEGREEEL
ncbi:hypothetical protein TNCV_914571 [Trichonephila clavipes]|uniref:Uncharacterized protein n=1 Tax=Trichonephila clavipes TaxID=2585209 RepID=A0A8X6RPN6_TRICX|nr:hypothetical protein TNCV_914571 [Trichonephila clavipes]